MQINIGRLSAWPPKRNEVIEAEAADGGGKETGVGAPTCRGAGDEEDSTKKADEGDRGQVKGESDPSPVSNAAG